MGRRTGASRKFPDISKTDRMETKEYFIQHTPEAANDPWSKESVANNFERYRQNPFKYIEELSRKQRSY